MRHRRLLLAGGAILLATGIYLLSTSRDGGERSSSSGHSIAVRPVSRKTGQPVPLEKKTPSPGPDAGETVPGHLPWNASIHYPAALAIAGMEENGVRHEALEALMETWVADDPQQAAGWAGSLPAGVFRDEALSSLMFHWGARDPENAALWVTRTGVDDPESVSMLAGRWSQLDPARAAAWAQTLANGDSRRDALSAIAGSWAATAPEDAAAWAARLPSTERTAAITNVLATWAGSQPAAAAAWLSSLGFDTQDEKATALAALITPWTAESPAAVSRFLNSLPEGPAREAAASQFAVSAAGSAPAEALMWAMNLADPEQRNQVVADACESWLEDSPDTFQAGISEALALMDDPAMRKGVFEMLYERDPAFHDRLLRLADQTPQASPPPAGIEPVPEPAPAPVPEGPDSSLLPPPETE